MVKADLDGYEDPLLARMDSKALRWTYESVMMALAVAVVGLLTQPDQGWVRMVNLAIWGIFVVDYGVRIALADDRRRFVRRNIPDLIAILPLDFFRAARVARLARLVRVIRAVRVLWRVTADARGVLQTNGLQWVLAVAVVTVVGGGAIAWSIDPHITTIGDGIWWAMVTSTTVGYGDLSPVHPVARATAVVIMVVGVGSIGMLTGSIANYFAADTREPTSRIGPQVQFVRDRLAQWEELSDDDRRQLASMLVGLAFENDTPRPSTETSTGD